MKKLFLCVLLALSLLRSNSQSLQFNGSTNYVNLTNDASLRLTSFTLEAWIRVEGPGLTCNTGVGGVTAVPVVTKGRGESDAPAHVNMNYFLGINGNKKLVADFEESAGANHPVISATPIADATWTHVAVTYESTSSVWKLYINGVLDATKDLGSNVTPASVSIQPAAIGTALNSKSTPNGFFKGRIDEVRIWNVSRSDADILNHYNIELTAGSGLVARFGLNEGSGSTANNSIATASDGMLVNAPPWTNGYNNTAPAAPVNPSPANNAYSAPAATTLCATVNDRNNDKLRVQFYGRKKVTKEKFTIILLPDTQFYTAEPQGKNGGNNAMFKSQTSWIAANRASRNIVYVGQLGDCVENGDGHEVEWKRADTAMKTIESSSTGFEKGVPYGICVGNHDQSPFGDPKGTTALYNKYFGASRFGGRPYYGGHSGNNNDNHYQVFSAGGIDFMIICPEYDQTSNFSATGGTLDWMENLVITHPGHNVIVLSHYVLTINATYSAQGGAIYNRLKKYPNFILMAGGHITQADGESRRSETYNGNTVHTLSSDYQTRAKGGEGRLRILEFDPVSKTMAVKTYSPYTNSFETDANSQFSLNVNLQSTLKPFARIGELSNLTPGSRPCFQWPSLESNADYEWYATVWDGERATTGPVWSFTTKLASVTNKIEMRRDDIIPSLSESFAVYPNPVTSNELILSLSSRQRGLVSIAVFDAAGRLRFQKSYSNTGETITFNHALSDGTYTIRIKTERGETSKNSLLQDSCAENKHATEIFRGTLLHFTKMDCYFTDVSLQHPIRTNQ